MNFGEIVCHSEWTMLHANTVGSGVARRGPGAPAVGAPPKPRWGSAQTALGLRPEHRWGIAPPDPLLNEA